MPCRFPEIDRLMRMPQTRPVTAYELDRIVEASGRTRGVFVEDPTAGKSTRRRYRPVEVQEHPPRDERFDDYRDW